MTADDVQGFIAELSNRTPLLTFRRFTEGNRDTPWSVPSGPYTRKFPSAELWDNCEYAKRLRWRLPEGCTKVYGLGSLYVYVASESGNVLYVGRAGETPPQNRIFNELGRPEGRPLTFPNHCWRDKTSGPDPVALTFAKRAIRSGAFYVEFFINMAPWGTFADPYRPGADPGAPNPFLEVSADLEAWVMARGGMPPLNTRNESRRRVVDRSAPWCARRS
jgi:hypothetical protein